MRALVTGAAGFIGSHLCEHLLADGHQVVGLDDLSTGSAWNLVDMLAHPRFQFQRDSILQQDLVDELVKEADLVFHLAAAVGVHTIVDDPVGSLRTNLNGTESVLSAALRHDCRVLIASTSEIYGKNDGGPLREDADRILGSAVKCRWSYASAKALDEMVAHTFWRNHGLRVVIVRPFNTVGPRQVGRYGMVVPRFVEQALRGEPLSVVGDGQQSRCFLHVTDLVPALIALIDHPRAYGEVFNLGGNDEIRIGDLAELIIELTGSSSSVVHVSEEEMYGPGFEDMRRRVPDTAKANDFIGFRPTMTIEEIVKSIVEQRRRLVIDDSTELEKRQRLQGSVSWRGSTPVPVGVGALTSSDGADAATVGPT